MKREPFSQNIDPKIANALRKKANRKGLKLYAALERAILDYLSSTRR